MQNEIRGMMRNVLQACPSLELKGTWEDSLIGEIGWPLTLTLIVFVLAVLGHMRISEDSAHCSSYLCYNAQH